MQSANLVTLVTLGWREWASLPDLDINQIKVKVDSGARTSALHAFEVETYWQGDQEWVRFLMHPLQRDESLVKTCEAPIMTRKEVSDSGGHREERIFIETQIQLGGIVFTTPMTLTNRDSMRFRMLLGRKAMENRFIIDPAQSYCMGKPAA